jgi:hypothetical protein
VKPARLATRTGTASRRDMDGEGSDIRTSAFGSGSQEFVIA